MGAESEHARIDDLPREFCDVDPTVADLWLDVAAEQVDPAKWGTSTRRAHVLLASHLIKVGGGGTGSSTPGPVSARKVGDVQESYAVSAAAAASDGSNLSQTQYGQAFALMLRRRTVPIAVGWRPWR